MADGSQMPEPTMEDMRIKRRMTALRWLHEAMAGIEAQDQRDMCAASLRVMLTDDERSELLLALVSSMQPDFAESVVREAFIGAGHPTPCLLDDALSDARFWASMANANELRAYAMACIEIMSADRREKLARWVSEKAGGRFVRGADPP